MKTHLDPTTFFPWGSSVDCQVFLLSKASNSLAIAIYQHSCPLTCEYVVGSVIAQTLEKDVVKLDEYLDKSKIFVAWNDVERKGELGLEWHT